MDQNFYNLLYNGYTGEFQLIGALYRNGLDGCAHRQIWASMW